MPPWAIRHRPPSNSSGPKFHLRNEAGLAVGGGVEFEDDEFVAALAQDGAGDVEGALGAAGPVAAEAEAVDPDDALAPALRVQVEVAGLGEVEHGAAECGADEGGGRCQLGQLLGWTGLAELCRTRVDRVGLVQLCRNCVRVDRAQLAELCRDRLDLVEIEREHLPSRDGHAVDRTGPISPLGSPMRGP